MKKRTTTLNFIFALILLLCATCGQDSESPNPDDNNNSTDPNTYKQAVGKAANDILSAGNYDGITLEIIAVDGYQLEDAVINDFKAFIEQVANKPKGITIKKSTVSAPGLAPYSVTDLISFEDNNRTQFNKDKQLTIYMFITEDAYTNQNVLGLAYRSTSFAIMGGRIKELTGGFGQPSEKLVLQTVLRHELGHLLGLVNVGTPMQSDHQDTQNGHHCDVDNCLMYYAVETSDFLSNIVNSSEPPALDSQCRADLRANGGK